MTRHFNVSQGQNDKDIAVCPRPAHHKECLNTLLVTGHWLRQVRINCIVLIPGHVNSE